jgi:outer membrane protein TolC
MTMAQSYDEIISFSLEKNSIRQYLPPLENLLDSAEKNSPLLKMYDSDIVIKELTIKSQKREWMKNMGLEAGIKYGLFDNLILRQDMGIEDLATSTTEQTRYNIGFSLRIPLAMIADKSELKMAREEKNKLIYEKANSLNELRKLIIVQYNNILKAHKKMIINTQQVESFRIQVMRADKEFENGIINSAEYARLSNMFSNALLELEESKLEFMAAIQLIQESVGINITLKTNKN